MRPSSMLRWRILRLAHEAGHRLRLKRRQLRALARALGDPLVDIPEREFIKTYRLGKETVRRLISEISRFIPRPRRADGISIELKVSG